MRSQTQVRLRSGKIVTLILLAAIAAFCSAGVAHRYQRATDPHLSLGEWEDPSVWWQEGKCVECHREPMADELDDLHVAGPEPKSHRDTEWRLNHGRSSIASEARCYTCHSTPSCKSCHDQPPETHTAGFIEPASKGPDSTRHAILARLNPSSCLVCHESLVTGCARCHAPSETRQWQQDAMENLSKWPELLEHARNADSPHPPDKGLDH